MAGELLRLRDVIAFSVALLLAVVTWRRQALVYTMEPAWYLDQRHVDTPAAISAEFPPLAPIITDLDGNGKNEIVLIDRSYDLKILSGENQQLDSGAVMALDEKYHHRLVSEADVRSGNNTDLFPIAIKAGYVTHYSETKERQKAIVVMRKDLTVECFDSTLSLKWRKELSHKLHHIKDLFLHYRIQDATIRLMPLPNPHPNMVVVGFSFTPIDHNSEARIHLEQSLTEDYSSDQFGINIQSQMEHFTVYALNASDGSVLWRHDGFNEAPEQFVRSLPMLALKVDLMKDLTLKSDANRVHDWTLFRQSLLSELPHWWRHKEDANLRIAHFVRRHIGAGAGQQLDKKANTAATATGGSGVSEPPSSTHAQTAVDKRKQPKSQKTQLNLDLDRFTGVETPKLSLSASLPHDAIEHTENPNVIVAHHSHGVVVLSLLSGEPITSLALSSQHMHLDVDGDGVIDTISVLETQRDVAAHSMTQLHDNNLLQHCMVAVTSGLPPKSQLFNGTLCQRRRHLHDPVRHHNRNNNNLPSAIKAAPPMISSIVDPKTLLESKQRVVTVAVNTGVVTSYSGSGAFRWQIDSAASWPIDFTHFHAGLFDADAQRADEIGGADKLHSKLLVVGSRSFSLLSLQGELLTVTELPNSPVARPAIGDFDDDGITDIIVTTNEAVLGYRLKVHESTKLLFVGVVVISAIAAFCFFLNIRTVALDNIPNAGSSSTTTTTTTGGGGALSTLKSQYKKNVLKIIRATDEHHID